MRDAVLQNWIYFISEVLQIIIWAQCLLFIDLTQGQVDVGEIVDFFYF